MSKQQKKLNENQIGILISQLEERYRSIHIIRERAQNISLWVLGIFATAAGWLIQSKVELNNSKKIFASVVVILAYITIRFYYLGDLNKGFKGQQRVAANIEDTLGLFKEGIYTEETILPSSWKLAGQKGSDGNFFDTIFVILGVAVAILILGIVLKGII